MRSLVVPLVVALLSTPAAAQSTFATDEEAVRAVVADYFWGRQNGDQGRLSRATVPEGGDLKGVAMVNGREALTVTPLAAYVARNTRPRALPTSGQILALDIAEGRMAWVKLKLTAANEDITDYLLLYRIGADWKIVNKMFVRSPNAAAVPQASAAVRP